jgi:hypothetical protein
VFGGEIGTRAECRGIDGRVRKRIGFLEFGFDFAGRKNRKCRA